MAQVKVVKEYSTYDNGIGGVSPTIKYAGTEADGQGIHMFVGYNGLLASKTNQPAGVIVGGGQYRNKAMKGEKLAICSHGLFAVDAAKTIGTPLYIGDDGHLVDVIPASGYVTPVAFVIRDYANNDMTATTSTTIMLKI